MSSSLAILGAGISGLALAFNLKQKGENLSLFEKTSRPGGWIRSMSEQGYFFECGPRSIRSQDSAGFLELVDKLNLQSALRKAPRAAFSRYLYVGGHLQKLPGSLLSALSSPLLRPHLWTIAKEPFQSPVLLEDESVHAFFSRRFSPSFADTFIDPMMSGIFAGDAKTLSIQGCLPKVVEMEERYGSLLKAAFLKKGSGPTELYTLEGGLERIITALADSLKEVLHLDHPIQGLHPKNNKLLLRHGDREDLFDKVISTLPAYALASLLPECALRAALEELSFSSVATVMLGYKEKVHSYEGFGYLVPGKEKQEILGVVFDSSAFPFQNAYPEQMRMTVMLHSNGKSNQECIEAALRAVSAHLGVKREPDFVTCRIAEKAIAQYPIGFKKWVKKCEQEALEFPGLSFLGTSFYGVSVNHSITQALKYELSKNRLSLQN